MKPLTIASAIITAMLLAACSTRPRLNADQRPPRRVILVIADGMGFSELALPMLNARLRPAHEAGAGFAPRTSALERLFDGSDLGVVLTYPHDALVTDSACAVTQLGAGERCVPETIGLDADGEPVTTALETARSLGLATGLVSDTRITHATPAGFAAHVAHRSDEDEIAKQLVGSGVDVMLSGGLRHWSGSRCPSQRRSGRKAPELLDDAEAAGYGLAFDLPDLLSFSGSKLIGLFDCSGMSDGIAERALRVNPRRTTPTLRDMTEAALRILSGNRNGFFLMVEAGQIDWAGHANDAGTLFAEMEKLEDTLEPILAYRESHPETTLVLTADHETGSFGISYSGIAPHETAGRRGASYDYADPGLLDRLAGQNSSLTALVRSFEALPAPKRTPAELARRIEDVTGYRITLPEARRILKDGPNRFYREDRDRPGDEIAPVIEDFSAFYPTAESNRSALIARAIAAKQKIVWGTGTHTAQPVPVAAIGRGSERFRGVLHATELGLGLKSILEEE